MSKPRKWLKFGRKKLDLVKNYRYVFNTPEGKAVLSDLMNQGFVLKPTHDPKSSEAGLKNEGKRELVLYIMAQLNVDPVQLLEKIKRAKQEDSRYELD